MLLKRLPCYLRCAGTIYSNYCQHKLEVVAKRWAGHIETLLKCREPPLYIPFVPNWCAVDALLVMHLSGRHQRQLSFLRRTWGCEIISCWRSLFELSSDRAFCAPSPFPNALPSDEYQLYHQSPVTQVSKSVPTHDV